MVKERVPSIVVTRGVHIEMAENPVFADFVFKSISRFKAQDWGECCEEDAAANNYAVSNHERIFASYHCLFDCSLDVWIICEADRSVTTVLFPDEY